MGTAVANADVATDPSVVAAKRQLDGSQQVWIDLGVEAGLLVASSVPGVGWAVDSVQLAANVASGNYGAAILDGIGFIPFGGDFIKGFLRGRRLRRAMRAADEALALARRGVERATAFARRRMASAQHWAQIRLRRQDILDDYPNCQREACRRERDARLGQVSNLPTNGRWVDANGNPVPAGEGIFVPNSERARSALSQTTNPATGRPFKGVPYENGVPDFSHFPPPGHAAPRGGAYSVEIDQALGPSPAGRPNANRDADRGNAFAEFRNTYPDTPEPAGGVWHHTQDGVTMQYVDRDVHTAATHTGSASVNTTPTY